MQTASPMPELTNALLDAKAFPAKLLYQFSDLTAEDQRELAKLWPRIPLERRRNLLKDLTELADSDNLMDFTAVGRTALNDEDTDVVCGGIDLLFSAEDKKLIPVFLKLLKDRERSEFIRASAANALGPYVFLGEMEELRPEILQEMEEDLLNAYTQDPSGLVQRRALESLGYSSREEVPALLRKAIDHPTPQWVESALFAMAKSADEQWEADVMEHLDDPNQDVRLQAILAAGSLNLSKARKPLLKLLSPKEDNDLRKEAIWALSQIGGEGVMEAFLRLQERSQDDEELNLLEEALDTLNFTNDSGLYELMDYNAEEGGHMHAEDDSEDEDPEGPDYDEWEEYLDEDGEPRDDEEDEEAAYFDNEDLEDDFAEDEF
ncbi:MAG: HEAT repeat domain-containing protein [Anaerolineaceae bacterium]|nr:HEAT repeat domain-containing protein [Anaerolineaceae bacterium]